MTITVKLWLIIGVIVTALRLLAYLILPDLRALVVGLFRNAIKSDNGNRLRTAAGISFTLVMLAASCFIWPAGLAEIVFYATRKHGE